MDAAADTSVAMAEPKAEAGPRASALTGAAVSLLKSPGFRTMLLLFIVYLVLSVVVFEPLMGNITTYAPGTGGDTYQNLWDIWWVNYALFTLHTSIYHTNMVYVPIGANLAYQTMAPLASLLSLPFQLVSIPFAYNIMLLIGVALSGLCMYVLSDYVVKNGPASFVAGLIFTFSSFHIAQAYGHIDWIYIGWVPLSVYFFLRLLRDDRKLVPAVGLGVSFVLVSFMGDVEQSIELLMVLVLILIAYALLKRTRALVLSKTMWKYALLAIILALVLGSWGFLPILQTISQPGALSQANYGNQLQNDATWSIPPASFFIPSYFNGIFDSNPANYFPSVFAADPGERIGYIGYTVIALVALGLYTGYKRSYLWIGLAAIFGLLAMGPAAGLYVLYHDLGPLNIIREPDRFYLVFSMAIAIMAAFGFSDLLAMMRDGPDRLKKSALAVVVVTAILLVESNGMALSAPLLNRVTSNASIPSFYGELGAALANYSRSGNATTSFSLLPLPVLPNPYAAQPALFAGQAMYYQTASHVPIVGGDLTRFNTTQELTLYNVPLIQLATDLEYNGTPAFPPSPVTSNPINQSVLLLVSPYNYRTAFVTVNLLAYNQSTASIMTSLLSSVFGNYSYYDNYTLAFNTTRASATLYKSFNAYPLLTDWQEVSYLVNGTRTLFWTPINNNTPYGSIAVSAPYQNPNETRSYIQSGGVYYINANLSFQALSTCGSAGLDIEYLGPLGSPEALTKQPIQITSRLASYSMPVRLVSGPSGNTLIFVQRLGACSAGQQQLILMRDIGFSRA